MFGMCIYLTLSLIYQTNQKTKIMKNLIASKTGQISMGSYNKSITAKIEFQEQEITHFRNFDICIPALYRVGYTCDSTDECYKTFEQAMERYNKISSIIN